MCIQATGHSFCHHTMPHNTWMHTHTGLCYGCALEASISLAGACPICRTTVASIVTFDYFALEEPTHTPTSDHTTDTNTHTNPPHGTSATPHTGVQTTPVLQQEHHKAQSHLATHTAASTATRDMGMEYDGNHFEALHNATNTENNSGSTTESHAHTHIHIHTPDGEPADALAAEQGRKRVLGAFLRHHVGLESDGDSQYSSEEDSTPAPPQSPRTRKSRPQGLVAYVTGPREDYLRSYVSETIRSAY